MKKFKICVFLLTGIFGAFCNAENLDDLYKKSNSVIEAYSVEKQKLVPFVISEYTKKMEEKRDFELQKAKRAIDEKIKNEAMDAEKSLNRRLDAILPTCSNITLDVIKEKMGESKYKNDFHIEDGLIKNKKEQSFVIDVKKEFDECFGDVLSLE